MEKSYSFIANSPIMLCVCALAISCALVQAIIFFRIAYKRALEIGITKKDVLKIVKVSAIFSIIPSLPILISYIILLPALGKFFPWLRLSVIGSATYETMAANMAVTSLGFESLGTADFSPEAFGIIVWVITLGMFLSGMSVFFLEKYDKKMQSISSNKNSFGSIVPSIMFVGMMATFSAPYLVNFSNILNTITIFISAISMILITKISAKHNFLKEFAFPMSMIIGMASACFFNIIL